MSEFAIRLYNIGKQYRIGQRNHYVTLRDTLSDALRTPLRFLRANGGQSSSVSNPHFAVRELKSDDYFWALRNVSFDVKPGEVVGIINMGAMFFEGLNFAIPARYVKDFLRNREAFAYDKENHNSGHHYHEPPGRKNFSVAPALKDRSSRSE